MFMISYQMSFETQMNDKPYRNLWYSTTAVNKIYNTTKEANKNIPVIG